MRDQYSSVLAANANAAIQMPPNVRLFVTNGDNHCVIPQARFYEPMHGTSEPVSAWVEELVAGGAVESLDCLDGGAAACAVGFDPLGVGTSEYKP